jgi:hypothetical protein
MSKYVGIWIDHKKAVIVSSIHKEQSIVTVKSDVEGHYRLKGGSRSKTPYGPQDVSSESKREGRYKRHLREYYQRVIGMVRDAESILVFGPGEAKHEFAKELRRAKDLSGKIAGIEAVDKMTEPQIAAKVKQYFISKA